MKTEINNSHLLVNLTAFFIILFSSSVLFAADEGTLDDQRRIIGCGDANQVFIKSIFEDKKIVGISTQVEIKKESGATKKAEGNMSLDNGDTITTGNKGAEVKLLFCSNTGAHEVIIKDTKDLKILLETGSFDRNISFQNTVYSKSGARYRQGNHWWGIFCPLGYVYVKGRGWFKTRTTGSTAGSRGTEYTLSVPAGNPSEPVFKVIEGTIAIRTDPGQTNNQTSYYRAAFEDEVECPSDATCVRQFEEAKISPAKNSSEVEVNVTPAKDARASLREEFDTSGEAYFNTLPRFTAEGVVPQYKTDEERRQAFVRARTAILIEEQEKVISPDAQKDVSSETDSSKKAALADNYTTLAKIYVELGMGEKALREFENAEKLRNDPAWNPPTDFLAMRAQAYILASCRETGKDCSGYLDNARTDIEKALELDEKSVQANAAFINFNLKWSLNLLLEGQIEDAEKASEKVDISETLREIVEPISDSQQKSMLLTLLGESFLRRADVDFQKDKGRKEQLSDASKEYDKAVNICGDANQRDSQNLYALKCLGDAKREKATAQREEIFLKCYDDYIKSREFNRCKDKEIEDAKKAGKFYEDIFNQSAEHYKAALNILDVFSPALYEFANLNRIRWGKEKEQLKREKNADDNYTLALQLDPMVLSETTIFPNIECLKKADVARLLLDIGLIPNSDEKRTDKEPYLYVVGQKRKDGNELETKKKDENGNDVFVEASIEKGTEIILTLRVYETQEQCKMNVKSFSNTSPKD